MASPEPTAAQKDKADIAARWIDELNISEKWQKDWTVRGQRIIRRYKNEMFRATGASAETLGAEGRRFAILWSNVQTIGPAIYAKTPTPIVTRRYKDGDPIGKYAAEVMERAIDFSISQYDFDERMQECRDDYLLVGRGQLWVRYVPHKAPLDQPEPEDAPDDVQVTASSENENAADSTLWQEALTDHVAYDDFGMQPCRSWAETDYVWRRVYMTRPMLTARFGPVGKKIPLDYQTQDASNQRPDDRKDVKKAAIYEIWDKPSGKVFWINKSWPAEPLDQCDDPLGLTNFFPCPRPLMATTPPDDYIPVADYIYYQDQAEELDELTQRIGTLTDALRMVGVYAGEENILLANMFNGTQNTLIPVNSMATLSDKGGLKGIVEWLPIDMVIQTLKGCFETRKQIEDDIYQITGLSDIIRGESNPNETATAQRLKGQWGSLRVRDRQKEISRFARDTLRLKAEIIAKWFSVDTLKAMTDVQLLTNQEKQVIQAQQALAQQLQQQQAMAQQAQAQQVPQQPGMPPQPMPQAAPQQSMLPPPDPEKLKLMALPTWEDVEALLKNDALRSFRVDIETDSTIEPDEAVAQKAFTDYVTAFTNLLLVAGQVLPMAPYAAPIFAEIAKESTRVFRVNPQLEDAIEQVFDKIAQMPPTPPPGQGQSGPSQQELALKQQELQLKQQDMQTDAHLDVAKLQAEQQRTQTEQQIGQGRLTLDAHQQQLDSAHQAREQMLKVVSLHQPPKGALQE